MRVFPVLRRWSEQEIPAGEFRELGNTVARVMVIHPLPRRSAKPIPPTKASSATDGSGTRSTSPFTITLSIRALCPELLVASRTWIWNAMPWVRLENSAKIKIRFQSACIERCVRWSAPVL